MSELISKQVAIEALKKIDQELWGIDIERSTVPEYIEHHEQIKAVRTIVQDLIDKILDESSAEEWIPCSEKLPEVGNTDYLATVDYGEFGVVTGQRFFYNKEIGWDDYAVVAWRPLPQPWKGEKDGLY